jgi:hypothetical protein
MTLFQILTISALSLLLLAELAGIHQRIGRGFRLVRCGVWLAALLAIAFPDWISRLGSTLGIGRGADLVSYSLLLFFLGATFYLYARCVRIERQLTEIVRHIAVQDARRGRSEPPG